MKSSQGIDLGIGILIQKKGKTKFFLNNRLNDTNNWKQKRKKMCEKTIKITFDRLGT